MTVRGFRAFGRDRKGSHSLHARLEKEADQRVTKDRRIFFIAGATKI